LARFSGETGSRRSSETFQKTSLEVLCSPISLCSMRRLSDQASMSIARHRCPFDEKSTDLGVHVVLIVECGLTFQTQRKIPRKEERFFLRACKASLFFFGCHLTLITSLDCQFAAEAPSRSKTLFIVAQAIQYICQPKIVKHLLKILHVTSSPQTVHQCTCNPPHKTKRAPSKNKPFLC